MAKKNDLICFKHEEVLSLCEQILNMDLDHLPKREFTRKIKRIQKLIGYALEDGRNMEERLQEYYHMICSIGFKRSRK